MHMENAEINPEIERELGQRARIRAGAAKWDLNAAIFLFAVLIMVIMLLFMDVRVELVSLSGAFGLAVVWLIGWRRGRRLYRLFYDEELNTEIKSTVKSVLQETIEEKVQQALRERY